MALVELSLIMLFVVAMLVVALAALFFWGIKHAIVLAINSVLGFFALYAFKAWLVPSLVINLWSVLLVAFFGIFGLVLVLLLHWLGVWF